jgi:hypothetical protein
VSKLSVISKPGVIRDIFMESCNDCSVDFYFSPLSCQQQAKPTHMEIENGVLQAAQNQQIGYSA